MAKVGALMPSEKGTPTEVGISWELMLEAINDTDEQFVVEFDLKYTWVARGFTKDWEAAGKPVGASNPELNKLIKSCWDPNVRVDNVAGDHEVISDYTACINTETGRMHRYTKMRLHLSEILELHRFPFDRQLLAIHLTTYRDTSEVIFVPYEGRPSLNKSRAARWAITHGTRPMLLIPSVTSAGLQATSGRTYHKSFAVIEAQRDENWYILHFVIPHCVIIAMNANVILIDRNDVADRNSVTLTLLLTAVAFQFLLVSEVPKKNYQTILDWVMTVGLAVQLGTCLLVFFNADNPHAENMGGQRLSNETVAFVERGFLILIVIPWIFCNAALIVLAKANFFAIPFDDLVNMSQRWLNLALGEDNNGLPSGEYALHRCGSEPTCELIKITKGVPSKQASDEHLLST